ncbi:hypothetical protein GCM10007199_21310 [Fictibacillus barbaricus]|nr:hypothetical protein GCM10007199_21310 [Fictibacillus barbaricus]
MAEAAAVAVINPTVHKNVYVKILKIDKSKQKQGEISLAFLFFGKLYMMRFVKLLSYFVS